MTVNVPHRARARTHFPRHVHIAAGEPPEFMMHVERAVAQGARPASSQDSRPAILLGAHCDANDADHTKRTHQQPRPARGQPQIAAPRPAHEARAALAQRAPGRPCSRTSRSPGQRPAPPQRGSRLRRAARERGDPVRCQNGAKTHTDSSARARAPRDIRRHVPSE